MRLGELLGLAVVDPQGRGLGSVRDVRLVPDGPPQPPDGLPAYRVRGVVVGSPTSMARLGYAYGAVRGPWLLDKLMRAAGRHLRYVPWEDVRAVTGDSLVVERLGDIHPREVE